MKNRYRHFYVDLATGELYLHIKDKSRITIKKTTTRTYHETNSIRVTELYHYFEYNRFEQLTLNFTDHKEGTHSKHRV